MPRRAHMNEKSAMFSTPAPFVLSLSKGNGEFFSILLGLCVSCRRKAKTGILQCQVCLARAREQMMAQHPMFCPECKKLIKPEERHSGKRVHKLCAQRRRARMYPQQHRLSVLAYRRTHRKMGLCSSCPRKVFKGRLCRKHHRMERERLHRAAG